MVDDLTKCPNCKMRTLVKEGDVFVCTECKGRFPAPAESEKKTRHDFVVERHEFYERNKDDIVRDYEKLGGRKTAEIWKINWAALYQVLRRWKIKKPCLDKPVKRPGNKPAKSSGGQRSEKHGFYEENRNEIIIDLLTYGRLATRKKWKIDAASSLSTLETRWLTPDQKARIDSLNNLTGQTFKDGQVPQFPPFETSWDPEVQIKWLDVYGKCYPPQNK